MINQLFIAIIIILSITLCYSSTTEDDMFGEEIDRIISEMSAQDDSYGLDEFGQISSINKVSNMVPNMVKELYTIKEIDSFIEVCSF